MLEYVKDASTRGIVIGHDHRYNSERWSKLTAAVFASQHVRVYLHKGLVHTPMYVTLVLVDVAETELGRTTL